MVTLEASRTLEVDELEGARKVLNAAALTYVASAAQAVMMVIYMLMSRR
ncbi:MAG: zinc metallopeptidase [Planctomycetota bacterium]